ncbi:epstein-barr virus ebna-1-like protein [Hordeum vulgare]|nr:epstein-barr virus ebna-1-like protein [Hordeum vulgare]
MASVRKFVNGAANLEGNLPVLQTWYYKKWRVHQLDSTISYASRFRPLIQNWSEEKAKKVDNIIQNNYLGVGEYVEDLMRPSIPTQDGTLAKPKTVAQIKVVVRRVLTDLQEVASLMREAGAEYGRRMYTLEKKMDECLRRTCTNGTLTEDLVKELNNPFNRRSKHHSVKATGSREPEEPRAFTDEDIHDESFRKKQEVVDAAIELMRHDEPTDTREDQLVYIERVAGVIKLERDGRIEK